MSPVTNCMDRQSLQALTELRASETASQRMNMLATRANNGEITAEERAEYESCVMFANFLGVLQSKARKKLEEAS